MAGHEKILQKAMVVGLMESGDYRYSGTEGCKDYDKASATIPSDLKEWFVSSQKKNWDNLVTKTGSEDIALKKLIEEITELRLRCPSIGGGTYNLFMKGIKVLNIKFELFKSKPVSLASPLKEWELYNGMIFRIVSELKYSLEKPHDSIDLASFINGIPLSTAELKNPLGNQGYKNAEEQYKKDRIPGNDLILHPSAGALFHLAVDTKSASLTTALCGDDTKFIPYNTGIDNTEWHDANSVNSDSEYLVSYLWKDILKKENICQIMSMAMRNVEVEGVWQTRFPRYHQFDNLRRIISSVMSENGNRNYLSQHAPGSGKSDEIANLAYALSTLQNDDGKSIYDNVLVINNRTVIDEQIKTLLNEKVLDKGYFAHISKSNSESKSQFLATQINSVGGARIIAVTAQTFSETLVHTVRNQKNTGVKSTKRIAIIVDEAHDGETGQHHHNMYRALLGESFDEINKDGSFPHLEDKLEQEKSLTDASERKAMPSLNFFAYTATPNDPALRLFGDKFKNDKGELNYKPFHGYSMKQAQEEDYIHDMLKNYHTIDFNVKIGIKDGYNGDEIVSFAKVKPEVKKWLQLQPEVTEPKADFILSMFDEFVFPKLNGQGKAMICCDSREQAVIFKRILDDKIAELPKEKQFGTLVAFSGSAYDPTLDREITELDPDLNYGLTTNDIANQFEDDNFRILIVADKYQVGYDQPKIMVMFINKPLKGIGLVQTVARANRRIKGKDEVHVFDFINKNEVVNEAFEKFDLETTLAVDGDFSVEELEKLKSMADSVGIHTSSHSDENDVDEYTKVKALYEAINTNEKDKVKASMKMAAIMDKCSNSYHKELRDSSLSETRRNELLSYNNALSKFPKYYISLYISLGDFLSMTRLQEKYGKFFDFSKQLSQSLSLSQETNKDDVDYDSLRVENFKLVETGQVVRDMTVEKSENTVSYNVNTVPFHMSNKMGPIELLIAEISNQTALTGQKSENVEGFVRILLGNRGSESLLLITRAKSNDESTFAESNGVNAQIEEFLHREKDQGDAINSGIATKLLEEQDRNPNFILSIARSIHRFFNHPDYTDEEFMVISDSGDS